MPKYRLFTNETIVRVYEVEADNESAARQAWERGSEGPVRDQWRTAEILKRAEED